jgi:multiple sugar transport system permease protein
MTTETSIQTRNLRRRLIVTTLLCLGVIATLYPLVWMILGSLKSETEIFSNPSLLPRNPTFENYVDGWNHLPLPFSVYLINSFVISVLAIVGNLIACSFAAYAFARLQFRGKPIWFALMLMGIMLPPHVTIIPQYVMFNSLGWIDTIAPIVVPKFLAVDSFFIFLMVQFIRGLPRELDEAARIDGCGSIRIFWHVILPLSLPALITVAIFTFVWTWNDFLSQLLYLTSTENITAPLALRQLSSSTGEGGTTWGELFAMSTISIIPLIVIFFVFQKRLVDGIATSGLKG